jgi:hypothetical protein
LRPPGCAEDEQPFVGDLLYFGASGTDGVVTAAQWAEFLKTSVTPRFPQGFTTWKASGQWRDHEGRIRQEETFVLNIAHPDDGGNEEAVRSLIREYKMRFKQESVLRVKAPVCVSL